MHSVLTAFDYERVARGSVLSLNFTTSVYTRGRYKAFTHEEDLSAKEKFDYAIATWRWRAAGRSGAKHGGEEGGGEAEEEEGRGVAQGVTGCRGLEITAGQAILSGQEQKDDPPRRITRDAPRCPVKLIREMLFNGE